MSRDTNFDHLSGRFKQNIYASAKGKIRLAVLQRDLYEYIPTLSSARLDICDAGAGQGQLAEQLAEKGHHLTLVDISEEMLAEAGRRFDDNPAIEQVSLINAPIQHLDQHATQQFDLILCHAVLEWTVDPRHVIEALKPHLKPEGYLSLMFYNVNSLIYFNALKGNFRKALSGDYRGHPGGLTPTNPIDPADVEKWLAELELTTLCHSGVRVVHDYIPRAIREQRQLEDMLQLELTLCRQEAFWRMGRYLHYLCRVA